jgi:hypothetical protein
VNNMQREGVKISGNPQQAFYTFLSNSKLVYLPIKGNNNFEMLVATLNQDIEESPYTSIRFETHGQQVRRVLIAFELINPDMVPQNSRSGFTRANGSHDVTRTDTHRYFVKELEKHANIHIAPHNNLRSQIRPTILYAMIYTPQKTTDNTCNDKSITMVPTAPDSELWANISRLPDELRCFKRAADMNSIDIGMTAMEFPSGYEISGGYK